MDDMDITMQAVGGETREARDGKTGEAGENVVRVPVGRVTLQSIILGAMGDLDDAEEEIESDVALEKDVARLRAAFEDFRAQHDFQPGDVVVFKECSGKLPEDGGYRLIVLEVDATPAPDEPGRTLLLGTYRGREGRFSVKLSDPRFYKPYSPPDPAIGTSA